MSKCLIKNTFSEQLFVEKKQNFEEVHLSIKIQMFQQLIVSQMKRDMELSMSIVQKRECKRLFQLNIESVNIHRMKNSLIILNLRDEEYSRQ
ncbi:unnamed protein product [Paramecium octaurelia]|uniref:Uncharacterized protein n=1 Tax=Paramecium octaurelia TaxID=43137 RepID=A0A8S1UT24_PAROT|nr:unnamed protein product [Paramecium octaurelia]